MRESPPTTVAGSRCVIHLGSVRGAGPCSRAAEARAPRRPRLVCGPPRARRVCAGRRAAAAARGFSRGAARCAGWRRPNGERALRTRRRCSAPLPAPTCSAPPAPALQRASTAASPLGHTQPPPPPHACPRPPSPRRPQVVGVGGGGSNAVNRMVGDIAGAELWVVNTDAQVSGPPAVDACMPPALRAAPCACAACGMPRAPCTVQATPTACVARGRGACPKAAASTSGGAHPDRALTSVPSMQHAQCTLPCSMWPRRRQASLWVLAPSNAHQPPPLPHPTPPRCAGARVVTHRRAPSAADRRTADTGDTPGAGVGGLVHPTWVPLGAGGRAAAGQSRGAQRPSTQRRRMRARAAHPRR